MGRAEWPVSWNSIGLAGYVPGAAGLLIKRAGLCLFGLKKLIPFGLLDS